MQPNLRPVIDLPGLPATLLSIGLTWLLSGENAEILAEHGVVYSLVCRFDFLELDSVLLMA